MPYQVDANVKSPIGRDVDLHLSASSICMTLISQINDKSSPYLEMNV